jgi:hypothetical protein
MSGRLPPAGSCLLALLLSAVVAEGAVAQSVRIGGSTRFQYVEIRPLLQDSIPVESVGGEGLLRRTSDGRIVRCRPEDPFCRGTSPGDPLSTLPVIQDLELTAWGFGEGIQVHSQLRGRTVWGGNAEIWPQADDAFDLLAAYAELDRERFRVRVGRQWNVSGLGFYNFDGVVLGLRPGTGVSVEGYAGRSLVRGLNESRTSGALEAVEELAPTEPGVLMGVQARYRPSGQLALNALYHRDIRLDRAGLYSELAAANGVLRLGQGSLEGAVELDVATGGLNEARLRMRSPPFLRMALNGEVRRYRPYFELWTIWGAFSPVGFDEARVTLTGIAPGALLLRGEASYRSYEESGDGLGGFRTEGWTLGSTANWSPDPRWRLEGGYRLEAGFGAARSDGHVGMVRQIGDRGFVALRALSFQRLYEFRLEEGTVFGVGADTSLRISDRARLVGGVTRYRHAFAGEAPGLDWNQLRGNLMLQWTLGSEPSVAITPGGER